jgi:NifU-like protein involved in Fe-S cluster formation
LIHAFGIFSKALFRMRDAVASAAGARYRESVTGPRQDDPRVRPDGVGEAASDCDDRVVFYLRMDGGGVAAAEFDMRGCQNTYLCARAAAELARGRSLAEARRATAPGRIADHLGDLLPADRFHAAELVSRALALALEDAASTAREPWRRLYRSGGPR